MNKVLIGIIPILLFISCSTTDKIPRVQQGQTLTINKTVDLKWSDWNLPNGCTITCTAKGKIKNGRIVGNETILKDVRLSGVRLFGSFGEVSVGLLTDVDSLIYSGTKIGNISVHGNGHKASMSSFGKMRNVNILLQDIVFDCSNSKGPFLYTVGNGKNTFVVENCKFQNIPEIELLEPRGMRNPIISNCTFTGTVRKLSVPTRTLAMNRFYECKGDVVFEGNTIRNCYGIAIDGIGFKDDGTTSLIVRNNTIDHVTNGGIVFNGGVTCNATIEGNELSNVFFLGGLNGENGNAENAPINFHGFKNLTIRNNTITDCTHSIALDLDGTDSDVKVRKGIGLSLESNTMTNVLSPYLFGVGNAEVHNNSITLAPQKTAIDAISGFVLNACFDVKMHDNSITASKPDEKNVYPIVVRQNGNRSSGKIEIKDNKIRTDSNIYLMIYNGFTGELDVHDNDAISIVTSKPLQCVNNTKGNKKIYVKDANKYK